MGAGVGRGSKPEPGFWTRANADHSIKGALDPATKMTPLERGFALAEGRRGFLEAASESFAGKERVPLWRWTVAHDYLNAAILAAAFGDTDAASQCISEAGPHYASVRVETDPRVLARDTASSFADTCGYFAERFQGIGAGEQAKAVREFAQRIVEHPEMLGLEIGQAEELQV
jgi:hypothetical protein